MHESTVHSSKRNASYFITHKAAALIAHPCGEERPAGCHPMGVHTVLPSAIKI